MENASDIILANLSQVTEIKPAGKQSLMAIAARALNPDAPATLAGICEALGLHPGLVIAVTVSADVAGDTQSRRELADQLIPRLRLRTAPPTVSPDGQLRLGAWCVDQLAPMAAQLEGLMEKAAPITEALAAGQDVDVLKMKAATLLAEELQRMKVVPTQKGNKSKLGIPDEEVGRRRAAQALRARLKGIEDGGASPGLLPTVAGETAGTVAIQKDVGAAGNFCLDLAQQLEELPGDQASRPLSS